MKLNITCPINKTSYGYVSSYFMKGLIGLGYDLRHIPIGPTKPDVDIHPYIKDVTNDFHYDAPCLKIWHQHDMSGFTGSPKIGFPIFELESFDSRESHSLGYPDYLFVCSDWAANVIKRSINRDVFKIPLGYEESIFKPCDLPSRDHTIFANFGKWELRKGHDALIKAFCSAFTHKDKVSLFMMPHNMFLTASQTYDWEMRYKSSKLGSKVTIIPRFESQAMVYNIMSQVHCGVFPARAEGWNLEALEILACGRHLIITDCTAHSEYANKDNSCLIKMTSGYEKAKDCIFFDGKSEWRSFGDDEFDQLVEYLRLIHKKNMEGSLEINKNGIETSKQFTWKKSSLILDSTLRKLCNANT